MSSNTDPHNVLITFVSRDLNLNRIGIMELINDKKYGGLSKIYLLYDGREPQDGWAKASVENTNKLYEMIKPWVKEIDRIAADPNNVDDKIKNLLKKEIGLGNSVFIDGTSLRRITLARTTLISTILGAKLFLVVPPPGSLYEPTTAYIKLGAKDISINDWAAEQAGDFKLLNIPKICPRLNSSQRAIIQKLALHPYDSVKSLLQDLNLEHKFTEAGLRENLRKLEKMEMVSCEISGKSISKINLDSFGRLASDVI